MLLQTILLKDLWTIFSCQTYSWWLEPLQRLGKVICVSINELVQKQKRSTIRFHVVDKRFCFCDADIKSQYLKILNSALSWFCGDSSNFILLIQYSTCTSFPDHFLNVKPNKLSKTIPNPIKYVSEIYIIYDCIQLIL